MFVVFLLKISLLQLSSSLLQKYGYRLFPGSYSIPRKLLRHQSSVTEIVGFEAEVKILLRSKDMDRLGDFLMSHAGLTADMYSNNRFFTNIVFNALLSKRKKNVVYTLIENLETNQKLPQIDTVHILISYAWKSSDARAAELLFSKYFTAKLKPNSRTLNIMMEGYRVFNDHSKVLQYYNLFAGNSILPDSYTYSTLVRIATNPTELLSLVNEISNNKHVRSPPLVRCIIETLGAFGIMAEAINMTQYLTGCDSIEFAEVSGDALMIALMRNCDTVLDKAPEISSFNYSCNCESIGNELFLKGSIKCGPKGINAVFNALQKKIRALLLQNHSNLITETESSALKVFEIRDALFNRTMGLMTSSLTGPNISWPLPINGRVCDSIIRSYMDDCSKAKFALKELVVFAKKADALSNGSFAEITEKALEALMFVAGANYRPGQFFKVVYTFSGWHVPS